MKVATLDGEPIYHWTVFKSCLADDVDRALILREFHRRAFKIPEKLVDDAVQQEISANYGGDRQKFVRHLQAEGASVTNFKQFTAEEIAVNAMFYQKATTPAEQDQKREEFLKKLRANAVIIIPLAPPRRNG